MSILSISGDSEPFSVSPRILEVLICFLILPGSQFLLLNNVYDIVLHFILKTSKTDAKEESVENLHIPITQLQQSVVEFI